MSGVVMATKVQKTCETTKLSREKNNAKVPTPLHHPTKPSDNKQVKGCMAWVYATFVPTPFVNMRYFLGLKTL